MISEVRLVLVWGGEGGGGNNSHDLARVHVGVLVVCKIIGI